MRGHTAIFGGYLSCLLIDFVWKSQWSEIVQGTGRLMTKTVLTDEIDMFPSQRCDMRKILFRYYFATLLQFFNRLGQIDCIPGGYRCHNQVEAACTVHLVFKGTVPQLPMLAGEKLAC